jgi:putative peptide zinc metalloprotease protein
VTSELGSRCGRLVATLPKLLLASLLFIALPAQPASGADTAAVAINTKDGSSIFKFAFHVHRTMNEVIEETNIAVAFASCEGCQTVAIAIQIVLVMSDPNVIAPENVAIAINFECTSCETLAGAYQFVMSTGDSPTFSKEGTKEIIAIRKAFHDLAKRAEAGQVSIAEIQAESEQLVTRLKSVLVAEFRPDDEGDSTTVTPSGDQLGTPEPEPTASAPDQASPSPSPSQSPSGGSPTPEGTSDQTSGVDGPTENTTP